MARIGFEALATMAGVSHSYLGLALWLGDESASALVADRLVRRWPTMSESECWAAADRFVRVLNDPSLVERMWGLHASGHRYAEHALLRLSVSHASNVVQSWANIEVAGRVGQAVGRQSSLGRRLLLPTSPVPYADLSAERELAQLRKSGWELIDARAAFATGCRGNDLDGESSDLAFAYLDGIAECVANRAELVPGLLQRFPTLTSFDDGLVAVLATGVDVSGVPDDARLAQCLLAAGRQPANVSWVGPDGWEHASLEAYERRFVRTFVQPASADRLTRARFAELQGCPAVRALTRRSGLSEVEAVWRSSATHLRSEHDGAVLGGIALRGPVTLKAMDGSDQTGVATFAISESGRAYRGRFRLSGGKLAVELGSVEVISAVSRSLWELHASAPDLGVVLGTVVGAHC